MVFKNLSGTTKSLFSIGNRVRIFLGQITKPGIAQAQDWDQRTTRDLVQYTPRWLIEADYHQLATHHEVHNLEGAPALQMEAGAVYIFDEGAVLIQ